MNLPLMLALAVPAVGALLVFLTGSRPNLREAMTGLASLATFGCVCALVPDVLAGARPEWVVVEQMLPGVPLAFEIEPLGMLYALVAATLWPLTSLYAVGYMRDHHETNQTRFFVCFALSIFAALGIAFAANLATLFLFYEVLTLCTYPLVTHQQTAEAKRAGRIYLGILMGSSVGLLLLAIAWTYAASGTLDFRDGGILAGNVSDSLLPLLLGLFTYGCGKAALMPLHRWLPNAMVAPTPVSALLHAVAVVKAGVFSVLKIVVYIFGLDLLRDTGASVWLMWVAAFSLLMGSLIAYRQDNLKARLAYSTIAQLAYIVLGAALVTPESILGGGMHIAAHAVGKITLFFCAGAILLATHKTKVSELDGVGRKMPLTMGAFFVASLSIIGLPPLGGMWSKMYLSIGAAEQHPEFVAVLMVSSLLSIGYLIPIPIRAFFMPPRADPHHGDEHHGDAGHADADHSDTSHSDTGHGDTGHSDTDHAHADHGDADHTHADHAHAHHTKGGWLRRTLAGEAPWMCVVPLCITAAGSVALFFFMHFVIRLLAPITGGVG